MPAFSGGTSLSKGWELIKRFSEDIDFKVGESAASSASRARRERTAYRDRVLEALTSADSSWPRSRRSATKAAISRPISLIRANSEQGRGCAPHIRVEMSIQAPHAAAGRAPNPLVDRDRRSSRPKWRHSLAWIRSRRPPTS